MTELEVYRLLGKNIKVVDIDDQVQIGRFSSFSGSNDNPEEDCSICIDMPDKVCGVEIFGNEIKSICVLER